MAAANQITVTIDVTGMDAVKDALARREAKISELQDVIRDYVCQHCVRDAANIKCYSCDIFSALHWDGEQA